MRAKCTGGYYIVTHTHDISETPGVDRSTILKKKKQAVSKTRILSKNISK